MRPSAPEARRATCTIHDAAWNRRIFVEKSGSNSTVVWNPWIEKTQTMADMAPDDWKEMICVETANAAENAVRLAPGESHRTDRPNPAGVDRVRYHFRSPIPWMAAGFLLR